MRLCLCWAINLAVCDVGFSGSRVTKPRGRGRGRGRGREKEREREREREREQSNKRNLYLVSRKKRRKFIPTLRHSTQTLRHCSMTYLANHSIHHSKRNRQHVNCQNQIRTWLKTFASGNQFCPESISKNSQNSSLRNLFRNQLSTLPAIRPPSPSTNFVGGRGEGGLIAGYCQHNSQAMLTHCPCVFFNRPQLWRKEKWRSSLWKVYGNGTSRRNTMQVFIAFNELYLQLFLLFLILA